MKVKWLDRRVLTGPHLILCTTEKEYLAVMKYFKIKNPASWIGIGNGAVTHILTATDSAVSCAVCIDITAKRPLRTVASILAHESVHVMQEAFRRIQEENPGDEIQAYVVEHVLEQLLYEYEKRLVRLNRAKARTEEKKNGTASSSAN